jgi:hypothetical protein
VQHPNISGPLPFAPNVATMLRLYYGYVATRLACNIQYQELSPPPSRHRSQHHMSATSKPNIRNNKN